VSKHYSFMFMTMIDVLII